MRWRRGRNLGSWANDPGNNGRPKRIGGVGSVRRPGRQAGGKSVLRAELKARRGKVPAQCRRPLNGFFFFFKSLVGFLGSVGQGGISGGNWKRMRRKKKSAWGPRRNGRNQTGEKREKRAKNRCAQSRGWYHLRREDSRRANGGVVSWWKDLPPTPGRRENDAYFLEDPKNTFAGGS